MNTYVRRLHKLRGQCLLIVLAYFIIIHVIEGDIVGPRIVGKAIGLHPVVSIIALIAGAELFGQNGAKLIVKNFRI